MDPGHRETDELLAWLERDIDALYSEAVKELSGKLKDYLRRYETKNKTWQRWVREGKKTKEEYQQWRTGQIMMGNRWEEMRDTLAKDLTNADQIARSIINGYTPEAYALNHNYATFEVEHGAMVDTSYTLYDRQTVERLLRDNPDLIPGPGKAAQKTIDSAAAIGKDLRWNRQHIQSAVLQGIVQGESIPKIASRMQMVAEMDRKAAIRTARTAMTGAENAGRVDGYKRAQDMGIDMMQQWVATLDSRTRHSHRQLDGETVEVDGTFSNGCRFPGDPRGDPSEVYNCRCTLIASLKGFERDLSDLDLRRSDKLGDMTYEQWKAEKQSTSNSITLPEEKEESIRQTYIDEYRSGGSTPASDENDAPTPIRFEDGAEANAYFGERPPARLRRENREEYNRLRDEYSKSQYGMWSEQITDEQARAINEYSGDAYNGINGLLRHQMTEKMVEAWDNVSYMPVTKMIEEIETAISEFELTSPIKVYRTCENDVLKNLNLEIGSTFHDDGFGSTSILAEKVVSGNIVMEIDVPAGKGLGAWINPLSGKQDEEYEFLLQRGSDYRVTDIRKNGDDTVVNLTLMGNTPGEYSYASKEEVISLWKENGTYDEETAKKI